eukprot:334457_1
MSSVTVCIVLLIATFFLHVTCQTTTTSTSQQKNDDDFLTAFLTFSIAGIPLIITLSIFFCIACITTNCSLWWYFKHIERDNKKLLKENRYLENQVSNVESDLNDDKPSNDSKISDEYYTNDKDITNNNVILPIDTDKHSKSNEDSKESKQEPGKNEVNTKLKHNIHKRVLSDEINMKNMNNNINININILKQFICDIRDNIFDTYTTRIQIPKSIDNRDNEYTINDLWKEIDKLKGIIYWYESAMKGHVSFCDEQYNKVINMTIRNNSNNNNNNAVSLKLNNIVSNLSLPERNMHIVQMRRNDKQALKQENYVNLMKKIASLSSIMHEEEKMSTPNYEYEEFICDKCTKVKTGLDEILIF